VKNVEKLIIIIIITIIPIVISPTGAIPKSLSQSLNGLNPHPNTYILVKCKNL